MVEAFGDLNGGGWQRIWIHVHRTGQSIDGNYSSYYGEVRYYGDGYGTYGATVSWSANYGGYARSGAIFIPQSERYNTYHVLDSFYFNHGHNAAGALGAWGASAWISSDHSSIGSGGASVTEPAPPTIPRASTPSFAPSSALTTGVPVTVNMNRLAGFTHDVRWGFGSLVNQTEGLSVANGVATSTTFTPPESMLSQIPNVLVGTGILTVTTKNGASVVGTKSVNFTVTAAGSVVPTVSGIDVIDTNSVVSGIIGSGFFLQGLSSIKGTVQAAGIRGSSIVSKQWTMNDITADSEQTLIPRTGGTLAIGAAAVDSRGRVGTFSKNIDVLPYLTPSIRSALVRRANVSNVPTENGTYLRVDLDAIVQSIIPTSSEKNKLKIKVYTKDYGSGPLNWILRNEITHGSVSFNGSFQITSGANFPIDKSYDVRIEVTDEFRTNSYITRVGTSEIFMHWGPDGTGYGKYHENGKHDFAGPIYSDGALVRTSAMPAKIARQVITANGSFSFSGTGIMNYPMKDWTFLKIIVIGGGGAGGGVPATGAGSHSTGSGGGGGGYAEHFINKADVPSSGSVNVTVGAGGTGVSGGAGNNGGTTTFGSFIKATGGFGGGLYGNNPNWVIGIPGDGGMGAGNGTVYLSNPPLFLPGGPGHPGGGYASLGNSGVGGSSQMGHGGGAQYAPNAGISMDGLPGVGYGGGGGGAFGSSSSTAKAGGAGSKGVIIVEFYA